MEWKFNLHKTKDCSCFSHCSVSRSFTNTGREQVLINICWKNKCMKVLIFYTDTHMCTHTKQYFGISSWISLSLSVFHDFFFLYGKGQETSLEYRLCFTHTTLTSSYWRAIPKRLGTGESATVEMGKGSIQEITQTWRGRCPGTAHKETDWSAAAGAAVV